MSLDRMTQIAACSSATPTWAPLKPTTADLIERIAKAESLLSRIREARADFKYDSGGPKLGDESHEVVEGWIAGYFSGSYFGDLQIEPSDPVLRKILEELSE